MEQILRVSLECFDLLFPQSLFVAEDVLLTFELTMLGAIESFFGAFDRCLFRLLNRIFLSWELSWCFLFIDHIISIVINFLLLFDLMRMVNDHICFQVELRGIQLQILSLFHTFLKILLQFIFKIGDNRMVEESLPLDSFA